MEKEKINYEEFLKKNFWSLHEAVSLVVGDVPAGDNFHTRNLLTYKQASEAIENGTLESETKELWFKPLEGVEGYNSVNCVEPRTFMKWRFENEGESAPRELLKFFNYDYWLSEEKEWWSFDEIALLLLSEGIPPFPHEIKNVFEISEFYNSKAKKLAQELLDTKTRRVDEEWLYWRGNGIEELARCCPNSCEDFSKERIFLSRNALFRIVKKHEKIFSYIPKSLLDKALKIIDKHDVDKIHSNAVVEHLLKMIRENSLKLTLNKICTPQEFLKTLAKLPNESGERNMKILMEIALNEIQGVGLSEEDSRRQSDIKEIRARFENLNEYSFLFKKDQELSKINFLSRDGDEDRGRLVDFIEWARGHNIKIPSDLEEATQKTESPKIAGEERNESFIPSLAGTALGLIIEEEVRLVIGEGNKKPKAKNIWNRIQSKKPWPSPIITMTPTIIEWMVPTTAEPKTMSYKNFQNVVSVYKKFILTKEKPKKSRKTPA